MKIRELQEQDAPLMLEWMHDPFVVEKMNTDFSKKTLQDCLMFIDYSKRDKTNMHMAVVDDDGIYMGTVSLKNIDYKHKLAEFAITIRKYAMGKGYSSFGMKAIIEYAFETLKLEHVYWCVASDNQRAIRFYDKGRYKRIECKVVSEFAEYSNDFINCHLWYEVHK